MPGPRHRRPIAVATEAAAAALLLFPLVPAHAWTPVRENVPEPPREFRAAWVASVYNIDWPSRPGLSAGQQQRELLGILERAEGLGLNAILLQVRPGCDALYASRLEPWSAFLTGRMGQPPSPSYDPLAFAVAEAHRRGIELHAWFNPFRALVNTQGGVASNHVTRTHPEAVRSYNNQKWLDPGDPWVRQYSIGIIRDVVRRYDIDGVHIDDYFYPYPVKQGGRVVAGFPDDPTYRKHGGRQDRADWRRDNIDRFVSDLYRSIKAEKPWVKFGISPFGIWRPGNPRSIQADLDAYADLYADSRKWLNNGWADYFSPQLYWRIQPAKQSFPVLVDWWSEQNRRQRHVWPGMASSRIGSGGDADGRPASEIIRQIEVTRRALPRGSSGHVHWSVKPVMQNRGGLSNLLAQGPYAGRALVPASPWLGRGAPKAPSVRITAEQPVRIRVDGGRGGDARWWAVQSIEQGESTWRLNRVAAGSQRDISLSGNPVAIAVRGLGASGVSGPPLVLRR
ncbi:MAG TPA: family 10 glycosylhydrolase [Verrucomicrobiales bacterium]|nr:family 10 glycosylhydrolase [Verrucomicrobiales bacterium]